MLMPRDKEILRFLEINKAISVQQATTLFFDGLYISACRRLKQLENEGFLRSYINKYNKQKVYYIQRPLSSHDLIVLDLYAELIKLGAKIFKFKAAFQDNNGLSYLHGFVKPDAYFEFDFKDTNDDEVYTYYVFLEVDYTHFTNKDKFIMYEKMFRDGVMKDECQGYFPSILVLRPTKFDWKYKSELITIEYGDMDLKDWNLNEFLL